MHKITGTDGIRTKTERKRCKAYRLFVFLAIGAELNWLAKQKALLNALKNGHFCGDVNYRQKCMAFLNVLAVEILCKKMLNGNF